MPVIMHSCGYVEPLLADMIDAGINCLQAMEVKAGMDVVKLHRLYGDKISFMGGIDIRTYSVKSRINLYNFIDKEIVL